MNLDLWIYQGKIQTQATVELDPFMQWIYQYRVKSQLTWIHRSMSEGSDVIDLAYIYPSMKDPVLTNLDPQIYQGRIQSFFQLRSVDLKGKDQIFVNFVSICVLATNLSDHGSINMGSNLSYLGSIDSGVKDPIPGDPILLSVEPQIHQ